jgi:hypothetical protein
LGVSRHNKINQVSSLFGAKLAAEGIIMADLRITGVTNNQLELQAPDGTRHYLEISDDLLKAMKSRPTSRPNNLTVRDIQTEIRLGTSVAELVARTGADEDFISKYAAPIITELNHIVTLARNIRLSLAGDRFTDTAQIEFGTVMDDRLSSNGATNIKWGSRKSAEGEWLVSVGFTLGGAAGVATWSFDPKNLHLVPENQSALQLSNASTLTIGDAPALVRPEQPAHPTNFVAPIEIIEEAPTPTASLSVVPELIEEESTEPETRTEVITVVESETRTTFHVVEDQIEETPVVEDEQIQETELFEEVVEEVIEVVEPEPVQETKPEEPYAPTKNQSTSRWAEVLFGSKDEDED